MEVLRATPGEIAVLEGRFPEAQLKLGPTDGKWRAREIVAHLADCELVFGFRLRQTLAEDVPVIQPFDQDLWAKRYANCDFASALRMFRAARAWNVLLVEGTTPAERERKMTHPERGTMTFWNVVETMAGHDLNHLTQLHRLAV